MANDEEKDSAQRGRRKIASFALASDGHPYSTGAEPVIDGGKTAHGG